LLLLAMVLTLLLLPTLLLLLLLALLLLFRPVFFGPAVGRRVGQTDDLRKSTQQSQASS